MQTTTTERPTLTMFVRATLALIAFSLVAGVLRADDAAATFKAKCVPCHGANGASDSPMAKKLGARDLRSAEVRAQTDAQLAAIVTNGKNKMPKYGDKLSPEAINALVKYIRTLK